MTVQQDHDERVRRERARLVTDPTAARFGDLDRLAEQMVRDAERFESAPVPPGCPDWCESKDELSHQIYDSRFATADEPVFLRTHTLSLAEHVGISQVEENESGRVTLHLAEIDLDAATGIASDAARQIASDLIKAAIRLDEITAAATP